MGNLGGPLGLAGGAGGSGYQAPSAAARPDTLDPSMQQQTALLAALQGQGGIQNQSNVYGQFQNIAAGQGPNPAQAMLAQQTGANVANQSALMAGQRGAGANAGLIARQAGQQGGALQQQAVGQGATMQANQSLNALNNAASIANNQVGNQVGQTNANVGSNMGLYQQEIAKQGNLNQGNVAMALQAQQQGQSALGSMMGGGGSMMSSMMGAGGGMAGQFQPPQNSKSMADGGMAQQSGPQSQFGQFLSSTNLGSYSIPNSAINFSSTPPAKQPKKPQKEGLVKPTGTTSGGYSGANLGVNTTMPQMQNPLPPSSADIAAYNPTAGMQAPMSQSSPNMKPGLGVNTSMSSGGMVNVVVSPDEKIVPPAKVQKAAGGDIEARTVPGKAKVKGDSYDNDTVPMKLPAGSIVIPRSKATNEKDAAAFVRNVLAKRGRK